MSQLTPDQAKFALVMALPALKSEHQTTKRVIGEALPERHSSGCL